MKESYNVTLEFSDVLSLTELNNIVNRIAESLVHTVNTSGLTGDDAEAFTTAITVTRGTKTVKINLINNEKTEVNHSEVLVPEKLTYDEQRLVEDYRNGYRGIFWHIDDFEQEANQIEDDGELIYDRTKFEYALDNMIHKHDCNIGITWDTVKIYLDMYCLLPEEDE